MNSPDFAIDALWHRQRTWMGWTPVFYSLRIEEDDEGQPLFEIAEQTESYGEEIVVSSPDPDEAASWITESIEEQDS